MPLQNGSAGFDVHKAEAVYLAWRMVRLTRAAGALDFEDRVQEFELALAEFLK